MKRDLIITNEPIDEAEQTRSREVSNGVGAVIVFSGLVRDREGEAEIRAIEYEAFLKMVEHQFGLIFDAIEQRWPVESIRLIHRVGVVEVNEPSLWVEVSSPHRGEAFAACQWLIDEMKRVVPIWKRPLQK